MSQINSQDYIQQIQILIVCCMQFHTVFYIRNMAEWHKERDGEGEGDLTTQRQIKWLWGIHFNRTSAESYWTVIHTHAHTLIQSHFQSWAIACSVEEWPDWDGTSLQQMAWMLICSQIGQRELNESYLGLANYEVAKPPPIRFKGQQTDWL